MHRIETELVVAGWPGGGGRAVGGSATSPSPTPHALLRALLPCACRGQNALVSTNCTNSFSLLDSDPNRPLCIFFHSTSL